MKARRDEHGGALLKSAGTLDLWHPHPAFSLSLKSAILFWCEILFKSSGYSPIHQYILGDKKRAVRQSQTLSTKYYSSGMTISPSEMPACWSQRRIQKWSSWKTTWRRGNRRTGENAQMVGGGGGVVKTRGTKWARGAATFFLPKQATGEVLSRAFTTKLSWRGPGATRWLSCIMLLRILLTCYYKLGWIDQLVVRQGSFPVEWTHSTYLDVTGGLAVNGAPDRVARAEHLFDGARQGACHGALAHGAGDVDHLVDRDVAFVLDVLHLLQENKKNREGSIFPVFFFNKHFDMPARYFPDTGTWWPNCVKNFVMWAGYIPHSDTQ